MEQEVRKLAAWFNALPAETQYKFTAQWLAIEAQGITQGKLAHQLNGKTVASKHALVKMLYAYDLKNDCFKPGVKRREELGIIFDDITQICHAINKHRKTVYQEEEVSAVQFYDQAWRQLGQTLPEKTQLTAVEKNAGHDLGQLAGILMRSEQWTTVPSVLRRSPNIDIRELYVELRILADARQGLSTYGCRDFTVENDFYQKDRATHYMNAESLLTRSKHRSVLVGPPGSGKSTLLRWLCVYLLDAIEQLGLYPIPVQLRKYADQLQDDEDCTLLQFAWQQLKIETGSRILQAPLKSGDIPAMIYLLDGWDEVPLSMRNRVRDKINAETSRYCTLITARQSGMPDLLQDGRTAFYEIGPLTDYAIAKLCQQYGKQRNAMQRIPELFNILECTPSLMPVAKNPYLLTLFCEVYFEHIKLPDYQAYAPHWVMMQASQLMRDDHNFIFITPDQRHIAESDFETIKNIAFQLSFGAHEKRTIFSAAQMQLPSGKDFLDSSLAISRFFNVSRKNQHAVPGDCNFEFSHLRLQEFFAAQYVIKTDVLKNTGWIANKFLSLAWREEIGFIGGELAGDADNAFWSTLKYWLETPDSGGEIIRRIAGILSVIGVEDGGCFLLNSDLRELLWQKIKEPERILLEENLSALLVLDTEFLVQKIQEKEIEDGILNEVIYRKIPFHFRRSLLDEQLRADPIYSWMIGLPARAFPAKEVIEELIACALDTQLAEADRIAALRDLGAGRVIACVPRLLNLMNDENTEIANAAIEMFGKIGGRQVAMAMAELLLKTPVCIETFSTLLNALTVDGYGVIESYSRDYLLSRINVITDIDSLKLALNALEGTVIPCPPERLLEILENTEEDAELRKTVVSVFRGITDACSIARAVDLLKKEPHKKIRNQLMSACSYIPVDYDYAWLWGYFLTLDNHKHEKQLLLLLFLRTLRQFGNHPIGKVLTPYMDNVLNELLKGEATPIHKCTLKHVDLLQKRKNKQTIQQILMRLVMNTELPEDIKALAVSALMPSMLTQVELEKFMDMLSEAIDKDHAALSDTLTTALFTAHPASAPDVIRLAASFRNNTGKTQIESVLIKAHRWGFLVFNDYVIGPDGHRVIA
ncbi:MAG: hypothetical protein KF908_07130 [Nitrosomonas sp.]|nr:hypothetical protein [Nitrosomonas sp.]MCW5607004.1 hypothetical protein [Nitrosomonas sp.]